MTLPCGITGSLSPSFLPARPVGLAVKLPCAFALYGWFPISLRGPSHASATLLEATAPVKLPARQCPRPSDGPRLDFQNIQGGISTLAPPNPEARPRSLPP